MSAAPDRLITSSRLRVWRECHRKAFFKYTLLLRTPQTPAMAFGTWVHLALECWYRAWELGQLEDRLPVALKCIEELEGADEIDRAKLRALVIAYHARWGAEPWDVLGVEVQFRYYLGEAEIGGKIDAIVRSRITGEVFIVEHKCTRQDASPGSPYWEKLTVDTQVSIYIDGATMLGHRISGCVYDVLKRPSHEPLKGISDEDRAANTTQGVGCSGCGGRGKATKDAPVEKGRGYIVVNFASEVKHAPCEKCAGTGWKLDKEGKPQAPRLYAKVREHDETIDEFEERLIGELASRPDDYLHRGVIVRLESELPKMRQELLDTIAEMRLLEDAGLHAPNHGACAVGRDLCSFFPICAGRASVDDETMFPRGDVAHPELVEAAA